MGVPYTTGTSPLFEHLLVAVDRRVGSRQAVLLGLRVAWCLGARVTVLFVVTATAYPPSLAGPHSHEAIDAAERVFRRIRRLALRVGVPCVCRYAFGRDAGTLISDAARANRCDLIVISAPVTRVIVPDEGN